ncbi:caspase recruitment domain-containing protein 18 [Bombina bombina]|uniref:caspase recruitment domain-containing protein 18 n=1 Tax=Bombina bombina TaxID=8345 RepID=UPI00235A5DDB|nr:caspase recruitment domain-containing protein 18 [Bombina bombina]
MAATLEIKRKVLVERIGEENINGLLDCLSEKKIINDDEFESITHEHKLRREKIRTLVDMIIRKGDTASRSFLTALQDLDPALCQDLNIN